MLIGVGSQEYKLSAHVANTEDPCILGLDFLAQSQACIDFKKEALLVGGIEVPLVKEEMTVNKFCAQISRIKAPRRSAEGHPGLERGASEEATEVAVPLCRYFLQGRLGRRTHRLSDATN